MRQLLIFVKEPIPGLVKTRLAKAVGPDAAAGLYRACTELTLARLASFQTESAVCVDPPDAVDRVSKWLGPDRTYQPQQGSDLGERLAHATSLAFSRGVQRVVVIGTDSPWLMTDDVATAFETLQRTDVVIGPTDDGGYYLLGLSRASAALFYGVSWGTPSVMRQTLSNARVLRLRVELLRHGYDVDHLKDVERFIEESRRNGVDEPWMERFVTMSQGREPCQS